MHFHHFKGAKGNVLGGAAEHVPAVVSGARQGARRHAELQKPVAAALHGFHGVSHRNVLSAKAATVAAENTVRRNLAGAGVAHVVGKVL